MTSSMNNVVSNSSVQTPNILASQPETSEQPVFKGESTQIERTPLKIAQDNAAMRRDNARMAALEAEAIKHANNLIKTYQKTSSNSDSENNDNSSFSPEPKKVYNTALSYSQRMDLIRYLEGKEPDQVREPSIPTEAGIPGEQTETSVLKQSSISVYA